jgi:hypothetical protein
MDGHGDFNRHAARMQTYVKRIKNKSISAHPRKCEWVSLVLKLYLWF